MRTLRLTLPITLLTLALTVLVAACSGVEKAGQTPPATEEVPAMTLELTSAAFSEGQPIPARYTCTGEDISPPLAWRGAPPGTQSFALIMDDPDAPGRTWVHWVVLNLPADAAALPAAIRSDDDLPGEAAHGQNSWRRSDYGGPCPPSGTHRYFFKLYALDTTLDLAPGATRQQVLDALAGHVLAEGQVMGTYKK
ncbi:MAG: YbhB/YbcL family Raf kinase inhibitor-like protein [Anaerolineae bacterium]|nr:YbhB/YbcL family Raf kinase inhibitor-like protein [Anaerolineae bacterium]